MSTEPVTGIPREPSETAKDAVAKCIGIVEGLSPQDRGYLLNRIAQVYFGAASAKKISAALNAQKSASKKAKPSDWKRKWKDTPEYQAWQSFIVDHKEDDAEARNASTDTYNELRLNAFRVRDELKPTRQKTEKTDTAEGKEEEGRSKPKPSVSDAPQSGRGKGKQLPTSTNTNKTSKAGGYGRGGGT